MTTPVVTELPRALESVTRDPFLDHAGGFVRRDHGERVVGARAQADEIILLARDERRREVNAQGELEQAEDVGGGSGVDRGRLRCRTLATGECSSSWASRMP